MTSLRIKDTAPVTAVFTPKVAGLIITLEEIMLRDRALTVFRTFSNVGRRPPCDTPSPISRTKPSARRSSMIRDTVGALKPLIAYLINCI